MLEHVLTRSRAGRSPAHEDLTSCKMLAAQRRIRNTESIRNDSQMNAHVKTHKQRPQAPTAAKILIVDDDTAILDVFPHLLCPGRYSIAIASRGSLALQLAAHRTFDLAFVDYFMEDMNGVEVSQKLRVEQPNIEIVLMSGYLIDEKSDEKSDIMARSGAREFLRKPFSADVVQALVDRLLAGKEPVASS